MFTDKVTLTLASGKGGQGCVAFRREKFVTNGGPNGGDGGKGGDVFFRVDNNTHTLSHFKGQKSLKAENGRPGEGDRRADFRRLEQQGDLGPTPHRHPYSQEPRPQHPGEARAQFPPPDRRLRPPQGFRMSPA